MKLRWYDRILVALSGLVLIALGAVVILAAGGVITLPEPIALDSWLGDGWQWMPLLFLAGALIMIWGLWLLIRPFRRSADATGKYYTLENKEAGDVRISVHAIDNMVRRCIDRYAQVESSKIKIGGQEDAMQITLHITLASDVQIPSLVDDLREEIISHLQKSAGVTVKNVKIYVEAGKHERAADDEIKYIEAKSAAEVNTPAESFINTASFDTTPIVVTKEEIPEPDPVIVQEPTVKELEKEVDLGPDEPLPVELSAQAFPFPEEEAGVPLEIYTGDTPLKDGEEVLEEAPDADDTYDYAHGADDEEDRDDI